MSQEGAKKKKLFNHLFFLLFSRIIGYVRGWEQAKGEGRQTVKQ